MTERKRWLCTAGNSRDSSDEARDSVPYPEASVEPGLEIRDLNGLNCVFGLEIKNAGIEIKFTVKRSFDVLGFPESVLLAFKQQIRDR